ncbi:TetR/AcrR family transcriptional regulator [Streptomyces sp. NPDC048720]|uniref:TetR/AcrR family transcriptional regulator n=1 Tax=Streptomyces sp. NPDC048720 TaxID=3365588 RepID=UPI0037248BAC
MATSGPERVLDGQREPAAQKTRRSLVMAAVEALRDKGFAGASAREIARRAGCNPALVFYHFGTVTGLHLAALDHVAAERKERYQAVLDGVTNAQGLVRASQEVFAEDMGRGYVAVLSTMVAAAHTTPELGPEIAARIAPWRELATNAVRDTVGRIPLVRSTPAEEIGHAVVALYLGLEMLASLDGDQARALRLFGRAATLASLLDRLPLPSRRRRDRTAKRRG